MAANPRRAMATLAMLGHGLEARGTIRAERRSALPAGRKPGQPRDGTPSPQRRG